VFSVIIIILKLIYLFANKSMIDYLSV